MFIPDVLAPSSQVAPYGASPSRPAPQRSVGREWYYSASPSVAGERDEAKASFPRIHSIAPYGASPSVAGERDEAKASFTRIHSSRYKTFA
ncbi:MAG: hypothetical protein P9L91_04475 [Candidatus Zophobacter franzmannii]|nr:hypothetical protein [Candidatus Zophobacter franzmannii]